MGILVGSTIRFKGKKDYTSIFKLNIIIIKNIRERGDDDFSDSDSDKNHKKIKISKFNKYYGEWEKFEP